MKQKLNIILTWLKEKQYLVYFIIAMGIMDVYLRFISRTMKSFSMFYIVPNTYTLAWVLILALLVYLANKRGKKITTIAFSSVFTILLFVQIIFSRIFSKFFGFKDIVYAEEGSEFLYTIFEYIKGMDIIVLILCIFLIVLSIYTHKYIKKETKKQKCITSLIVLLVIAALISFAQIKIGTSDSNTSWDSFSNKRNIYHEFNDTKRSMMLVGLYEYTFRDFYLTFIKSKEKEDTKSIEEIHDYINSNNKTTSNYNGIFKDKNLILIMLEDIDTWMLNEAAMPTLYEIKNNSIDFTNHFSPSYASGFTFNTEFIANTGLIPKITALKTSYQYNQNNYDYSLANLFKENGYIVNSIHKNRGSFYNRDNMHLAWGYENHYDYAKLATNGLNIDLDTTVVGENLDKFIYNSKFMTFWISYSAHMPYEYVKPECSENLEYTKSVFNSDNEEYICAMSQSKVTDDAIKMLLDELTKKDMLDDTVLIFFSDHYAYSMDYDMVSKEKQESNSNLLTKVPFFIYNNGKYAQKIDLANDTIDILPTIADLFGLDYNPNIYFGDTIFSDNYKELVVFNDKSWYDGKTYYTGESINIDIDDLKENNDYANKLLSIGGKIIETDYFRKYTTSNNKK